MTSSGRRLGRVPKFREFSLKQLHQAQPAYPGAGLEEERPGRHSRLAPLQIEESVRCCRATRSPVT